MMHLDIDIVYRLFSAAFFLTMIGLVYVGTDFGVWFHEWYSTAKGQTESSRFIAAA